MFFCLVAWRLFIVAVDNLASGCSWSRTRLLQSNSPQLERAAWDCVSIWKGWAVARSILWHTYRFLRMLQCEVLTSFLLEVTNCLKSRSADNRLYIEPLSCPFFLLTTFVFPSQGLLSFLSAPLIGALSDVWGRKSFLLLTVFFTCAPIPLMKISPWFVVLLELAFVA